MAQPRVGLGENFGPKTVQPDPLSIPNYHIYEIGGAHKIPSEVKFKDQKGVFWNRGTKV